MRLLDRILYEGFVRLDAPDFAEKYLTEQLEKSQMVVIDNVAAYHLQNLMSRIDADQMVTLEMTVDAFPNVMLPFEHTFLEMRLRDGANFEECGVYAEMVKPEEVRPDLFSASDSAKGKDANHSLVGYLFNYKRHVGKTHLQAVFELPVGANGQILPINGEFPYRLGLLGAQYVPQDDKMNASFYLMEKYVYPCLLALSFMHCRNVKVLSENPPLKLSKKYQKKTGRPLLRYRVLQIDHMKQVLEREGGISQNGLKKALHICRGHFARYGQEGKGLLFGKHAATVWVPMHSRGSAQEGVVVKDYKVK